MTLNEWVVLGDVGTSSKTMWAAITGAVTNGSKGGHFDVPYDWDDFSRCYKLVRDCHLLNDDLQKVSNVFPWWKPFIDNWGKLCNMYESGSPMFGYIQSLEKESRIIDGWVESSPGRWERKQAIGKTLKSPWYAECSVCGQIYKDHSGSTPCCGAISYLVETPIEHITADKPLCEETKAKIKLMADKAFENK